MDKDSPSFLLVLDEKYIRFAELNLKALSWFYPKSKKFLYDVGNEKKSAIQQLAKAFENVVYIHWPRSKWLRNDWIETLDFSYFYPNYCFSDLFKSLSRRLRYRLFRQLKEGWIIDKNEFVRKKKRVIYIWSQKAVCCQDCIDRTYNDLVFLDADAIVWRRLDSVFLRDFDVALTLRRQDDIRIGTDHGVKCSSPVPYHAINAGVLFFRNNDCSRKFLRCWIERIQDTKYHLVEQTALATMLLDIDNNAFEQYEKELIAEIKGSSVKIKLLPCEFFNNIYIGADLTFNRSSTYVVHFKGYMHGQEYDLPIKKMVEEHLSFSKDVSFSDQC